MERIMWTTEEPIGDIGGFGEVYKSRKKIDGVVQSELYAKKKLKQFDEDSIKRFQKEIRILDKLNHPRVVKVEGYRLSAEPYFYVMPLYKGSLYQLLPDIAGDLKRIKDIFNEIFDGVEYLHDQGIFHRDLKPQNILMNSDTDLVISDLGLGVDLNSDSERLTRTGDGGGTRFYTAPEQWDDMKHIDERADIYSLGAMIYVTCTSASRTPVADFSTLPVGINLVVQRCMKYKAEERFQSVSELRDAFDLALDFLLEGMQNDDLTSIMASLTSSVDIDGQLVDRLAHALNEIKDDPDTVHSNLMKLPEEVFEVLANRHPAITEELVGIFVNHVTGQGWPWDYTDKIGNQCSNLFFSTSNHTIRAKLLYATLEVAVSHNRWYVMGIFEKMIKDVTDATESFEVVQNLTPIKNMLNGLNDLKKKDVNTILQSLF